jgi:hypothetical protein
MALGALLLLLAVVNAYADSSITVTASAGSPDPSPGCVGATATSSLSASATSPTPPYGCELVDTQWSWDVQTVQFSSDGTTWAGSPGGDSESVSQPDPTSADATLSASFTQAGYWKITLAATVTYTDSCGNTWSGTGTTTVSLTAVSVAFSPDPAAIPGRRKMG